MKESIYIDQEEVQKINQKVLKKLDPSFSQVLSVSNQITVLNWQTNPEQWNLAGIVGTLFIIKRDGEPRFRLIMLNKKSNENLVQDITPEGSYERQGDFLMFADTNNSNQNVKIVRGLLFQEEEKCAQVSLIIQKILSTLPSKVQNAKEEEFWELRQKQQLQNSDNQILQLIQKVNNQNSNNSQQRLPQEKTQERLQSDSNNIKDLSTEQQLNGANLLNMLQSNGPKGSDMDILFQKSKDVEPQNLTSENINNKQINGHKQTILDLFGDRSGNPDTQKAYTQEEIQEDLAGGNLLQILNSKQDNVQGLNSDNSLKQKSKDKKEIVGPGIGQASHHKTQEPSQGQSAKSKDGNELLKFIQLGDQTNNQNYNKGLLNSARSNPIQKGVQSGNTLQGGEENSMQQDLLFVKDRQNLNLNSVVDQGRNSLSQKKIFTPQDLFGTSLQAQQASQENNNTQRSLNFNVGHQDMQLLQSKQEAKQKIKDVLVSLLDDDYVLTLLYSKLKDLDLLK